MHRAMMKKEYQHLHQAKCQTTAKKEQGTSDLHLYQRVRLELEWRHRQREHREAMRRGQEG